MSALENAAADPNAAVVVPFEVRLKPADIPRVAEMMQPLLWSNARHGNALVHEFERFLAGYNAKSQLLLLMRSRSLWSVVAVHAEGLQPDVMDALTKQLESSPSSRAPSKASVSAMSGATGAWVALGAPSADGTGHRDPADR